VNAVKTLAVPNGSLRQRKDVEHMTDKKVWFNKGATSIGLIEEEVVDLLLQVGDLPNLTTSLALDALHPTWDRR